MRSSPAAPCGLACGASSSRVPGTLGQRDAHGAIVAWAKRRRKHRRKHHRRSPLHAGARARTTTRTRTRSSIPSPPMPAVATQPDSQSNKDGAEKRQLHRSYLVHTHAHARTQVNTHARTYTHTDSACVERAHTGATSMINLPQPLLCFETTRR